LRKIKFLLSFHIEKKFKMFHNPSSPEESSDRLELALEPEAACIACEAENPALENGDTFMVLDCGGGTVDITMHRVAQKTPDLLLDELCSPSGGPWGSTFIDAEFEKFVEKLIGTEAFRRFKPSSPWVEVMRAWETFKLDYNPSELMAGDTTIAINMSALLEVRHSFAVFTPSCTQIDAECEQVVKEPTLHGVVDAYNARFHVFFRGWWNARIAVLACPYHIEYLCRPTKSPFRLRASTFS
jgi:hypothetical protein